MAFPNVNPEKMNTEFILGIYDLQKKFSYLIQSNRLQQILITLQLQNVINEKLGFPLGGNQSAVLYFRDSYEH
jgi:hypothetical protein